MIDIHNHIIPFIDDGAGSNEQALALLKLAFEDGVSHLVCTPHMHPGRFENDQGSIRPAFDRLSDLALRELPELKLAMAAEVRFSDALMVQVRSKQIPMIGHWEGDACLLLEMPHQRVPTGIERMLNWLGNQGIRAVIAHPERNKELMRYPERTLDLVSRGALLQVTAGSVAGYFGEAARSTARWLFDREAVHFIASDAHHPIRRPPAMTAATNVLDQWVGEKVRQWVTQVNPEQLTQALFSGEME